MNLFGLILCLGSFSADTPDINVPPAARDETFRRGSAVEILGFISADKLQPLAALGPPADDSHKWFISIITKRNDAACAKLKQDWAASAELRAFATPDDPAQSWAHYSEFRCEDETQNFRWKAIQLQGYPTILVQPPRTGQYGEASTVVCQQTGYDGDSHSLARIIRATIMAYVARRPVAVSGAVAQSSTDPTASTAEPPKVAAYNPPFVCPAPEPVQPATVVPAVPFQIPPAAPVAPVIPAGPTINPWSLLMSLLVSLLGGVSVTNVLLIAVVVLAGIRTFRKATGQKLLLDDESFEKLLTALRNAGGIKSGPIR